MYKRQEESRTLYREAMRTGNHLVIPADTVQEQLREASGPAGALVCDYDFFKAIYHAEARSVARSGAAIHIALLLSLIHIFAAADQKNFLPP